VSRPALAPHDGRRRLSGPAPLTFALAVGLALRLYCALTRPIDYNGWWHVFIARNLSREYGALAHPPLFLLLLKALDALSPSRLAYVAVPVLAGTACIALVHRILARLGTAAPVPFLGALTMATAASPVLLSCDVQSYMLATLLILGSLVYGLDLVAPEGAPLRTRAAFALLASLALATEYFAGLYLAALCLSPLLIAPFRPAYRRGLLTALSRRLPKDVLTLLPPLAVAAALYLSIARFWIRSLNHLPEFYFQAGVEPARAFLIRNLWNLFNLFSPLELWSPRRAAALVTAFALAAFAVAVTQNRVREPGAERAVPGALLCLLLAVGVALGLRGAYPFGGAMRQQFLYFVFALLAGFVAFDRLRSALASAAARRAVSAAGLLLIAANLALHWRDLVPLGRDPFTAQAAFFDRSLPGASAVQVDQFNLIGFFIPHHDWRWTYAGALPGLPSVQRYELRKGGRAITLLAHRDVWNFDLTTRDAQARLKAAAAAAGMSCTAEFVVHQNLYKPVERKLFVPEPEAIERAARASAGAEGLELRRIEIRGGDVYAELCSPGARPSASR
jgi:hypothetical protein